MHPLSERERGETIFERLIQGKQTVRGRIAFRDVSEGKVNEPSKKTGKETSTGKSYGILGKEKKRTVKYYKEEFDPGSG